MDQNGWRWEPVIALLCVVFLPAWVYGTAQNLTAPKLLVLGSVAGSGLGFSAFGLRRGRLGSRILAGACLTALLGLVVTLVLLVWLRPELFV